MPDLRAVRHNPEFNAKYQPLIEAWKSPKVAITPLKRRLGSAPLGVAFTYAPARDGLHAERILQGFGSILQVDGSAGYNRLIAPDRVGPGIQLASCWAHARRKLIEITRTGPAPIAEEDVTLIRALYAIEVAIKGTNVATRLVARQELAAPILARPDPYSP